MLIKIQMVNAQRLLEYSTFRVRLLITISCLF